VDGIAHQFPGWTVVEKLGEGGMCVVYRAHREGAPDDQHALKVLVDVDPSARRRFLDEGAMLMGLRHPNLLTVEAVNDGEPPWIVMELLAGRDLEAHRDSHDAFAPERVVSWIADIAQALQQCHDAGIVHRDIKPSNLMLGQDGTPRLIDFGVARQTDQAHKTRAGVVMGTASYLPPEVFLESRKDLQDAPAADVYALGQTLVELLVDRPIHRREDVDGPHMLVRIMRDKVTRPYLDPREWNPRVSDELARIAIDATRQDPEDRIPSAAALEERLRAWSSARRTGSVAPVSLPPATMPTLPTQPFVPRQRPTMDTVVDDATDDAPAALDPPEESTAAAEPTLVPPEPTPVAPEPLRPTREPLVPRLALGMGAVGLTLLGVGAIAATVGVALLGLWLARGPDPTFPAALQGLLTARGDALRQCVAVERRARLTVATDGARLTLVTAEGVPAEEQRCLASHLADWPLDHAPDQTTLDVVLRPR
jgi:serine/threonine-protein kinase